MPSGGQHDLADVLALLDEAVGVGGALSNGKVSATTGFDRALLDQLDQRARELLERAARRPTSAAG